jgi:hypothetical protein
MCVFSGYLFADGDLLVVFHNHADVPAFGHGLAKLDKDSNVLWRYSARVHHQVDVGEDGSVYALTHEDAPTVVDGLELVHSSALVDNLVRLSPAGKELAKLPILEAFRNSPYASLVALSRNAADDEIKFPRPANVPPPRLDPAKMTVPFTDLTHANSVKVLSRRQSVHFPMFKAGQLLISLRNLNVIAVVDMDRRSVAWAATGPWRKQHDAQFLDNGHLLIYDNAGSPKGSQLLEYHPATQAFAWVYSSSIVTKEMGTCQRLPNGNTLMFNEEGIIDEVTPSRKLVWRLRSQGTSARRFGSTEIGFLPGHRPRP